MSAHVRYWHLVDITTVLIDVRFWAKRTSQFQSIMSAFDPKRTSHREEMTDVGSDVLRRCSREFDCRL
jgi:hypothetical protein